jgi:cyclophilin family peptidyl-prolyl cis-trans isomerase
MADEECGRKEPGGRDLDVVGDIESSCTRTRRPETVKNFLAYVRVRSVRRTIFHRVIRDFMIQGGGMTPDMKEKGDQGADQERGRQTA